MKLGDAEQFMTRELKGLYEEGEALAIANLAMEHVTGLTKTERLVKKADSLLPEQWENLQADLRRLKLQEPVQYVTNRSWFYGMELYVDQNVLIPRPETEELVGWIIDEVRKSGKDVFLKGPADADETTLLKILDVGTGSGCIALALKKAMPRAEVWGCDVSEEALNVARRNGSTLNIRVDFQGADFLDELQQKLLPAVDLVVSNPPYIPLSQMSTMRPNVVNHEPHRALFVPENDALVFYRALAAFGRKRMYQNGVIFMEIHEDLGHQVMEVFQQEGYDMVQIKKDMQGKNRMVKVQRTN